MLLHHPLGVQCIGVLRSFAKSQGYYSGNGPLRRRKRPIKEANRPINTNGLFSGAPPWLKTAPLKRPIKRSTNAGNFRRHFPPDSRELVLARCQNRCFFEPSAFVNNAEATFGNLFRAELKGQTKWDKRVSGKICSFLRFSAKICGFLRFSAKICASEML